MGDRASMVMVGHPQVMRAMGGQCMIVTVAVVGIEAATRAAAITFLKIIHPDAQSCKWHVHAYACVIIIIIISHHHVLVFLCYGGLINVGGQLVVHLSAT